MKVLIEGHRYLLDSFEGSNTQGIQFIQKVPCSENSHELRTENDGTTNEEVLKMLIDRMNYLQNKAPCRENAIAITHIETALLWLEERTRRRKAKNVEGTKLPH